MPRRYLRPASVICMPNVESRTRCRDANSCAISCPTGGGASFGQSLSRRWSMASAAGVIFSVMCAFCKRGASPSVRRSTSPQAVGAAPKLPGGGNAIIATHPLCRGCRGLPADHRDHVHPTSVHRPERQGGSARSRVLARVVGLPSEVVGLGCHRESNVRFGRCGPIFDPQGLSGLWPARPDSVRRRCPTVDIGLRRPVCCSAGVAAVGKCVRETLGMDNFFITPRDLSAADDERGFEWPAFEGMD